MQKQFTLGLSFKFDICDGSGRGVTQSEESPGIIASLRPLELGNSFLSFNIQFTIGLCFVLLRDAIQTRSKGSVNLPQGSVNLVVLCKVY